MYVNCWQSFSGSEKGHIARGNNSALYGWTVLGKFHYDLSLDVTALDRGGGRR